MSLANHFSEIITGADIVSPKSFRSDVSAKALPNLWASVGWIPMHAKREGRFQTNQPSARVGFVDAEILGSTGLLRIKEIDGNPVRAQIDMTVKSSTASTHFILTTPLKFITALRSQDAQMKCAVSP